MIYKALDYYWSGDATLAHHYYFKVWEMFDGNGIYDIVTHNDNHDDNYKLALLIYASKVLDVNDDRIPYLQSLLWSKQDPITGDIIAWSDMSGKPRGSSNCETTSLTLFALNES